MRELISEYYELMQTMDPTSHGSGGVPILDLFTLQRLSATHCMG
ncbi:MAG: hypothetical protein ACLFU4_08190 [Opitutales bacterium]